jgi:hypothetical protein
MKIAPLNKKAVTFSGVNRWKFWIVGGPWRDWPAMGLSVSGSVAWIDPSDQPDLLIANGFAKSFSDRRNSFELMEIED